MPEKQCALAKLLLTINCIMQRNLEVVLVGNRLVKVTVSRDFLPVSAHSGPIRDILGLF